MEIKFINVSIKDIINKLNIKFNKDEIIGIYGDNYKYIINLLLLNINYTGSILVNNKLIKPYTKRKFSYIEDNIYFYTNKVSDEFYLIKKDINDSFKKYIEKIESCLNMVGLSKDYLDRKINTLSISEKKLLQIALGLISNPELIILDNPFIYLDGKNKIRIKEVINELKNEYHKTIILYDDNINNIYELSNQILIFKDNVLLINGTPNIVFKDLEFLIDNEIELPDTLKFILEAKKYGKELSYTNNIMDLLKDVYKNV